jgi:hypothetical protein
MNESDYTIASNTAHLRAALNSLGEIVWGCEGDPFPKTWQQEVDVARSVLTKQYFAAMERMNKDDDD